MVLAAPVRAADGGLVEAGVLVVAGSVVAVGVGVPVAPRETMDSQVEVAIVVSGAVVRAATGEQEAVKERK